MKTDAALKSLTARSSDDRNDRRCPKDIRLKHSRASQDCL
jgi:hypothetical protein